MREAESGARYTPSTTFETFAFPWPPGRKPADDPRVMAIAGAARELVEKRDRWLNPEGAAEAELKQRTLTRLYYQRPTWLDLAHTKLDRPVLEAYGWPHAIVDVVLDTVGGDTQQRSWAVLKPGGILISTVQPPDQATAVAHGVRQSFVSSGPPIGKVLKEVATMVDAGAIKPTISTIFPLQDIRKAHELSEGRHTHGKIALCVVP